ncbi:polysaccharide deacetylase family protein [Hathewaya histolytica]|uniref:Peptidoglycan N-acetylglucosamine deacetylase n=1 Tax=Hathewaya histolytica TaxID=1498 RepID=A0A4U9R3H6_HATHI|nr:polysaccharide deacetylase family protein [Hathewaya histolytica]VTQ85765.1 peptidoglycan N-acetylglucosamine deacetylase [Hathewaya histolytica]
MRNSNRRNQRKSLSPLKILLFAIFIVSFSFAILTQTQAILAKNENKKISNKLTALKEENKKSSEDMKKLENDIEKLKSEVKENMKNKKVAYLTFDDGPSRKNTRRILKTLKDHDVKATFFVNGHPGLEELYKEIVNDGHALANHTYSHDYSKVYSSVNNFKADVKKLDKYLEEVTGQAPNYLLRYPGGSNNTISYKYGGKGIMKDIVKEMSKEYEFFDWNVDSTDASAMTQKKDKIVQSVLSESKSTNQAVILMHDLDPKTTTADALPEIIKGLKAMGFEFDKMTKDSYAPHFTKVPK